MIQQLLHCTMMPIISMTSLLSCTFHVTVFTLSQTPLSCWTTIRVRSAKWRRWWRVSLLLVSKQVRHRTHVCTCIRTCTYIITRTHSCPHTCTITRTFIPVYLHKSTHKLNLPFLCLSSPSSTNFFHPNFFISYQSFNSYSYLSWIHKWDGDAFFGQI